MTDKVNKVKCPLGHTRVWRKGYTPTRSMGLKARYVCFECGKTFYPPAPQAKEAKPKGKPGSSKKTAGKKDKK